MKRTMSSLPTTIGMVRSAFLTLAIAMYIAAATLMTGCSLKPKTYPEHLTAAIDHYAPKAKADHAPSAYRLATLIERDPTQAKHYGPAMQWYEQSCQLHYAKACDVCYRAFEHGIHGAPHDRKKAFQYAITSAKAGNLDAMGSIIYLGDKPEINQSIEALTWAIVLEQIATKKEYEGYRRIGENGQIYLMKKLSEEDVERARAKRLLISEGSR